MSIRASDRSESLGTLPYCHDGCRSPTPRRSLRGTRTRPAGSADQAVGAVRILQEVLGVAAGISAAMLRQKNAVCVVCPTGTSPPDVIRVEARIKVSAGYCTAYVFDESAHDAKCGIQASAVQLHAASIGRAAYLSRGSHRAAERVELAVDLTAGRVDVIALELIRGRNLIEQRHAFR